ncbi:MAG: hypothetical protein NTV86_02935 [Planctomycetota bacterium]|nr:hypothetical protein [Planctomycetota bacterium]
MKKKAFDCVEMARACREKVYEQTKDMTPQQEIEFYRQAGDEFRRRIADARRKRRRG